MKRSRLASWHLLGNVISHAIESGVVASLDLVESPFLGSNPVSEAVAIVSRLVSCGAFGGGTRLVHVPPRSTPATKKTDATNDSIEGATRLGEVRSLYSCSGLGGDLDVSTLRVIAGLWERC